MPQLKNKKMPQLKNKKTIISNRSVIKNRSKFKKEKPVILNCSVLVEKCSKKDFIYNSEHYLNNLGIGIYIFLSSKSSIHGYENTYASVANKKNLSQLLNLYDINTLFDFYKVMTSNKKLKKLQHLQFNLERKRKSAFLKRDSIHNDYSGNRIMDESGETHLFLINCMTKNILNIAGYKESPSS
jgi:hypothetical protein